MADSRFRSKLHCSDERQLSISPCVYSPTVHIKLGLQRFLVLLAVWAMTRSHSLE